jgi:hypothetical protein
MFGPHQRLVESLSSKVVYVGVMNPHWRSFYIIYVHLVVWFIWHWCSDANISARHAIDSHLDAMWMQFIVRQCVHLMSVKNNKQKVTTGKISNVGGMANFTLSSSPIFATRWTSTFRTWMMCVSHIHMRQGTMGSWECGRRQHIVEREEFESNMILMTHTKHVEHIGL